MKKILFIYSLYFSVSVLLFFTFIQLPSSFYQIIFPYSIFFTGILAVLGIVFYPVNRLFSTPTEQPLKNKDRIEVRIEPLRIYYTGCCLVLIFIALSIVFIYTMTQPSHDDSLFFTIIFCIALQFSFLGAIQGYRLLKNYKHRIQFYFDKKEICYIPVQFDKAGKYAGFETLQMFFSQPTQRIEFNKIASFERKDSFFSTSYIYLHLQSGETVVLPFLYSRRSFFLKVFALLESKRTTM